MRLYYWIYLGCCKDKQMKLYWTCQNHSWSLRQMEGKSHFIKSNIYSHKKGQVTTSQTKKKNTL